MDSLSLRIKYRPLRIGWCLADGDLEGFRKALKLTHMLWGGRFNPIIPVGDFDHGRQLVNLFRADILLPVSEDEDVKSFIEQFPHLPHKFKTDQLFKKTRDGSPYSVILDIYHPIRHLFLKYFKNNSAPTFRVSLYQWEDTDPLSDVLLATFGDLLTDIETGTNYREMIKKYLDGKEIKLAENEALPSKSYSMETPNSLCRFDLNRHRTGMGEWNATGFYVGSATDFYDLVNYWNIRATDANILFYDSTFSKRLDSSRDAYRLVLDRSKASGRLNGKIVIWSKIKNEIDLASFSDEAVSCAVSTSTWNGLNLNAPIMHFGEKSVLASVGDSYGKTNVSSSLPEKPCFTDGYLSHQHLVASINTMVGLLGNEQETLTTPYLPELNEYYGRNFYFGYDKARVEPDGIGIIIDAGKESLSISGLDVSALVSNIFSVAGMRVQPSKPGLIATRLIKQLGGLQGCRVFKIAGIRKLIEKKKNKDDQSFTRSNANQIIGRIDPETENPNFEDYENLYIEQRDFASKLRPEDAFKYLLKYGVFRAGLKFECPNCHLDFWISIDNVGTHTKCENCWEDFDVSTQLKDRDWRYKRSGLFGKENNQEGAIPVTLTLQQLDTAFEGMLYTTAMDINPLGSSVSKCETDFVVLTQKGINHEVQIAIGECKTRMEITGDDVSKLKSVANALEKKGIRVFIIFSKLSDFTDEELERCSAINDTDNKHLILLTARELEPYHFYEKTAEEFEINQYAVSLEDMVSVTQAVFYEKRMKDVSSEPES